MQNKPSIEAVADNATQLAYNCRNRNDIDLKKPLTCLLKAAFSIHATIVGTGSSQDLDSVSSTINGTLKSVIPMPVKVNVAKLKAAAFEQKMNDILIDIK